MKQEEVWLAALGLGKNGDGKAARMKLEEVRAGRVWGKIRIEATAR